ncbi:MAG: phosphoribosylglycinamide formyltransferase [Planctomycetota bacterium]
MDPTDGLARPLRVGVLVSGGGTNLQAILDAVAAGTCPIDLRLVLSNKPGVRALGRATAAGVPSAVVSHRDFDTRPAFDAALVETLRGAGVDVVALAGFMRLLTPTFLDAFPLRVVNVHPALCPAFPGVDGPAQAVDWGVKVSGCTVHFVDPGTDTGPIIEQVPVPVLDDDDARSLHARIQVEEHRALPRVLGWLAEGRVRVAGRRVSVDRRG